MPAGTGSTNCVAPAPFVPVPYPNIAQSSDTSQGSTTVKADGNPIMLQGSSFAQSSGDEAGSAGGGLPLLAQGDLAVGDRDLVRWRRGIELAQHLNKLDKPPVIIFTTGFPLAYYAARYNIDLDLITRGSGFGYYGSVVTNVIFATFTFIFFPSTSFSTTLVFSERAYWLHSAGCSSSMNRSP